MTKLLPVIDILNNLITVNNFLMASQAIKLPSAIVSDPANDKTVEDFQEWQQVIWQSYFEGLLNAQIIPQSGEINQLYNLDAATQAGIQSIFFETGNPISKVISSIDQVVGLLSQGQSILAQLESIAKGIRGADLKQVAAITKTVNQLNDSFNQDQQTFNQSILDEGKALIATVINVTIDLATDQVPVEPLLNGITQIGEDIITQIKMSKQSVALIGQLEDQWAQLDQATANLAQMSLVVRQIDHVVTLASSVFVALSAIAADWQQVTDVSQEPAKLWQANGSSAMQEWASRMSLAGFASTTMQLNPTVQS